MKTAFWIVLAGFLIASAGRAAQIVVEPLVAIQQRGQEITALRRERDQRRADNEQLRKDIAYLNSNAGVEQEARRRGWVKPGEVALSIVVPETAPETRVAADGKPIQTASADDHLSVADRIRTVLDTCLSVFGSTNRTR
jgi:cell division protein FtsB